MKLEVCVIIAPVYTLEFEIPGLPKLINAQSRGHWSVAWREAQKWKKWVFMIARSQRPPTPLKKARLEFTRFSFGLAGPDCDNLAGSFKAVRDGLVKCGIIEDDSPEHVVVSYGWQRVDKNKGKIRVRVEEIVG